MPTSSRERARPVFVRMDAGSLEDAVRSIVAAARRVEGTPDAATVEWVHDPQPAGTHFTRLRSYTQLPHIHESRLVSLLAVHDMLGLRGGDDADAARVMVSTVARDWAVATMPGPGGGRTALWCTAGQRVCAWHAGPGSAVQQGKWPPIDASEGATERSLGGLVRTYASNLEASHNAFVERICRENPSECEQVLGQRLAVAQIPWLRGSGDVMRIIADMLDPWHPFEAVLASRGYGGFTGRLPGAPRRGQHA